MSVPERQLVIEMKVDIGNFDGSGYVLPIRDNIEQESTQQFLVYELNKIIIVLFLSDNRLVINKFFKFKILTLDLLFVKFNQRKSLLKSNYIIPLSKTKYIYNCPILQRILQFLI